MWILAGSRVGSKLLPLAYLRVHPFRSRWERSSLLRLSALSFSSSNAIFSSAISSASSASSSSNNKSASLADLTSMSSFESCPAAASPTAVAAAEGAPGEANPLLQKESLPKFEDITIDHVVPALQSDLDALKSKFKGLEEGLDAAEAKKDYASVVEDLERIQAPLSYSWRVVGHLMGVKNSEALRKAHDSMQPLIVETYQVIGQSEPVFKALSELKGQTAAWEALDQAQQRIVDSAIKDMKASGVDLAPSEREYFNKLKLELAEQSTKFSNNVLDSIKQFKLRLTQKEKVDGLPASALALAAQSAGRDGDAEATAESGPWLITLDQPSYLPCMQHMKRRDIREQLYRAYISRASAGKQDNSQIILRILQLKLEMARMLGYACHAEKSLSTKMASSAEQVMELIQMLREQSFPAALKDLQQVRDFAKAKGCEHELQLWDISFWSERLREEVYQYEEEQLRAYFPLPSVLEGLFGLARRLFGVKIVAADGDAQIWHADVRFFKVLDEESGEEIASFYLDPYSRPAEKRGGAWMDVCQGRSKVLRRKPVAYLVCNGSPPVGSSPSLMTFREVETLFHEFGHGLQHMLTKVEHGDAAGISNVEWDAVELPSQFMENWCYERPTLNSFAKHYQTGEPLPEELFNKIKAAKNFQSGLQMIRQLYFGAMDMHLHSKAFDPSGTVTPFEVQRELAKIYTVISPLPEDRFLCSFGHIFAGGYSAGYYSYKWAEVMSADAFAAFEEAGLSDEEAVRSTGRRFRDTVLAMGGGRHPSEVFRAFRGRDPSPQALLRHSGLI